MKTICLILLITITNLIGQPNQKNITYSNQQWIQDYIEAKLSTNWIWLADAGFRWKDAFNQRSQYLARTGLGYNLHSNIQMAAGAAVFGFYSNDTFSKFEFRPYQELIIRQNFEPVNIQHRFRSEERFFWKVEHGGVTGKSSFNFRFRYRFLITVPLLKLSILNSDKILMLNLGDEIYINAGDEIVFNVFDQNRVLIGPIFQFSENLKFSLLYNFQFGTSNGAGEYKHDDVLWLGINHKFDWSQ